jgi:hypothetical protein
MDFYLFGLAVNCKRATKLPAFTRSPSRYHCLPSCASISADEKGGRASGKIMQLYYEYTFWCLPAGVDPEVAAALNWQEIIF